MARTKREGERLSMCQVDGLLELFELMVDKGASDLHLKVLSPPVLHIDGVLIPQEDLPPLTAKDVESASEAEHRDRRGWRLFTENDLDRLRDEVNQVIKLPM